MSEPSTTGARLDTGAATLYAAVLGERFAVLPPTLRRFHSSATGASARGALKVVRGRGLLAAIAGWFVGAPAAGDEVPITLRVEAEGTRELWTRHFAGRPMVTRQWIEGERLVEAVRCSRMYFELAADERGMVFHQRRCTILGVPMPAALAPRVDVQARADPEAATGPDSWEIEVVISLPLVGTVLAYSGTMIVEA